MKGKLNKIFATTALATALVVGSIIPTFADDSSVITSISESKTSVSIGVTKDLANVANVNVTVPTVLTLAVVAESESDQPDVYIGGSETDTNTSATAGEGNLSFINKSHDGNGKGIPVTITKATVSVSASSNWQLVGESQAETATDHQMSITLGENDELVDVTHGATDDTIKSGASNDIDLGFTLNEPSDADLESNGKTTNVPITATAYGTGENYDEGENEAEAFTVEWVISSNTSTLTED